MLRWETNTQSPTGHISQPTKESHCSAVLMHEEIFPLMKLIRGTVGNWGIVLRHMVNLIKEQRHTAARKEDSFISECNFLLE